MLLQFLSAREKGVLIDRQSLSCISSGGNRSALCLLGSFKGGFHDQVVYLDDSNSVQL